MSRYRPTDGVVVPASGSASLSRRDWVRAAVGAAAVWAVPVRLDAAGPRWAGHAGGGRAAEPGEEDLRRLHAWVGAVRAAGLHMPGVPLGRAAAHVGENALGTPYEAFTLEAYLRAGGSPSRTEPLALSLTRFDCVTLVEASLALARLARTDGPPSWDAFGREMARLRYRGGEAGPYVARLHYFSEWIADNADRGGLRDLGRELGGVADTRALRFMSGNPESYPALADPGVLEGIRARERSLDGRPRWVVPTERIAEVEDGIRTGDVIAFATSIEGLDVTHAAFAYRTGDGVLRVLHAPLSGGVVEVTEATLTEYVRAIRRATGVLVARPLPA